MSTRSIYLRSRRKLVLAFDIGTTYSGISFRYLRISSRIRVPNRWSQSNHSVLDPGQVPEIKGVTRSLAIYFGIVIRSSYFGCRFPAQEHVSGGFKIPTVIYYDLSGKVRVVGAEALKKGIREVAEDENWVKVEW